jgi:hypothetical protein
MVSNVLQRLLSEQKSKNPRECRGCEKLSRIAYKTRPRELLIPHVLGSHASRFTGASYAKVPPNVPVKFKDCHRIQNPCLQIPKCMYLNTWNYSKAQTFGTYGPFLKSLTLTNVIETNVAPYWRKCFEEYAELTQ